MATLEKNKFKVSKWIMMSLAILFNAFIIVYSCLDSDTTIRMNYFLTNLIVGNINALTEKEVETIPLESIEIKYADENSNKYNYIPGYELNEIPLGSAKQIDCFFAPENATNKSISYSSNLPDCVQLDQNGSSVSIVGMKLGECVIEAKSSDGNFVSKLPMKIVETKAPNDFEISVSSKTIPLGTTQTIDFDIDGGVLTHNELINFRYYDIRKLSYSSSDISVATVDGNGVIHPVATGASTINVSNGLMTKSLSIQVTSGGAPTPYSDLNISGSDVCFGNDMLLDQNSKNDKYRYQLVPKDGTTELDPNDFVWESSNELLVRVDKHGVMRGFRKTTNDDETAVIKATSKTTGQYVTYPVTVKNQIPTAMNVYMEIDGKKIWDKIEYSVSVGDNIPLKVQYNSYTQDKNITVSSSNEELISVTNQGSSAVLHVLKEGDCSIKVVSSVNPELTFQTSYKIVKAGAISSGDVESLGYSIRKTIGHAFVFTLAQIFTYLTIFMFFNDLKWWFHLSVSLTMGLYISGISEIIQSFIPSRSGSFIDVLINFAGAVVGAAFVLLGLFIAKKIKAKKLKFKKDR